MQYLKIKFPKLFIVTLVFVVTMSLSFNAMSQHNNLKVRIAIIEIDPDYITEYRAALAEHAAVAVKVEPGVLTLNAVYDRDRPTHVTVFEVYASDNAYQAHLKTKHFLKYKNGTQKMVKSLFLTDVEPIALQNKLQAHN